MSYDCSKYHLKINVILVQDIEAMITMYELFYILVHKCVNHNNDVRTTFQTQNYFQFFILKWLIFVKLLYQWYYFS